jgi:LysM repeat protein
MQRKMCFHNFIYRNFITCILCLLFSCAIAQERSSNIQTFNGKKYYIHIVGKGQSVYAISKLYNVTPEEIYEVNPELRSGARAKQEIKVPVQSQVMATRTQTTPVIDTVKYNTYKVQKSETVYYILRKFNLTEKELLAYNPFLSQGLKEGQVIIVGEKPRRPVKDVKDIKHVSTARESKPIPEAIDSFLFKPISKPKKEKYNVALMLPFRLDKMLQLEMNALVKSNVSFPPIPALAVDFYLGFKNAVDSLRGAGFDINLQLYDIDDKDSARLAQLVYSPQFKELDFIFGPLYASEFKTISKKARELSIPIVSPITQQNKILYNNIYISKTNPSQFTLLESLADYCIDSLLNNNANLILMSSGFDKKEGNYVAEFRKYFNDRIKLLGRPLTDTVKPARGLTGVKTAFVPNVRNIIISLSTNQVFIADFTTQLAMFADEKDIILCGWQNISTMDNIDQEYLNQLHFTFPHQFNTTNINAYKKITDNYSDLMNTFPGEYFFIGFDVAHYYLKNLKEKGPDFIYTLNSYPEETNYMRFKFARPDNTTGFDNRGVYIFRYNNYQLHKTGWK